MFEFEQREKQSKQELANLKLENSEWEMKTRQLYVEIQQNEIIQEKKEYEQKLKFGEVAAIMKD